MKKTKQPPYETLIIADIQGDNIIEVQKDCSQIRIKNENGDVFIDTNKLELIQLVKMIQSVIDSKPLNPNPHE